MSPDAKRQIRNDMANATSRVRQRRPKDGRQKLTGTQPTIIENEIARNMDAIDDLTGG